jgi:hypothetical protein
MFVGTKDMGAKGCVAVEDHRMWMAKAIVALHRKHGDSWGNGAHKGRTTGGPAAMIKGLAQHFQYVAAKLWQFIQEEHAVVRQRHLARPRHLPSPDQPHIGDGVRRGPQRAGGDDGGTGAGAAGDARDAHGVEGVGQGHRRQDGGEEARQPRGGEFSPSPSAATIADGPRGRSVLRPGVTREA